MDSSRVVIDQMNARNHGMRDGMTWVVGDATSMDFDDGSFDLVFDKGTLDALYCSDNSTMMIATYLKEVMRVLGDHGVYLCISFGKPTTRTSYMESPHLDWDLWIA